MHAAIEQDDGLGQVRLDHFLELFTGQADLLQPRRQRHDQVCVRIAGQRLFGFARFVAQCRSNLAPQWILSDLDRLPGVWGKLFAEVIGDDLVEQFAADVLIATRPADDVESAATRRDNGRVERSAAEVVYHHVRACCDADLAREGQRGSHRLGYERRVGKFGFGSGFKEAVETGAVPRRRMGEADLGRRLADLAH